MNEIEIEAPDGSIVAFPAGTDDETILRVMRENYGGPGPSPAPTMPEPQQPAAPVAQGPRPQPQGRPSQAEAGEPLRPAFMAAAGMAGSVIPSMVAGAATGIPLGPGGMLAGGARGALTGLARGSGSGLARSIAGGSLGTAAGSALYDAYRDVRRLVTDDPTTPPDTTERLKTAGREGISDAAFSMGVAKAPAMLGGFLRKMMHVPEDAADVAAAAKKEGIDLGVANVAEKGPAAGYLNVFGRFPVVGGGAKKLHGRQVDQLHQAQQQMMDRIGPSRSAPEVSEAIEAGARSSYNRFKARTDALYSHANRLADTEGAIIPTDALKQAAKEAIERIDVRRLPLEEGVGGSSMPADAIAILHEVAQAGPGISVAQLRDLDTRIENLMTQGFKLHEMGKLREVGKQVLDDAAEFSPAARMLKVANEHHAQGMKMFETPTAKQVGRIEQKMFQPGLSRPGNLNPDELSRVALNVRSPKAVADLRRLAGRDAVKQLTRHRLDDAWSKAFQFSQEGKDTVAAFDPATFKKALGLDKPNSAEYMALKNMLYDTGVSIGNIEEFVKVAEAVFRPQLADASTFVSRGATLQASRNIGAALRHGATGGLLGLGVGTAATTGTGTIAGAGALISAILLRGGASALMRPTLLKAATKTLDPNAPQLVKLNSVRVLRQALDTLVEAERAKEFEEEGLGVP